VGKKADICIFDEEHHWVLDESNMTSFGKNTPFKGWEFKGRVTHTLYNGKVVFRLNNDEVDLNSKQAFNNTIS
jgi:dihydroorotase